MSICKAGDNLENMASIVYNKWIMSRGTKKKKHPFKTRRKGLPVLDSDQDFLRAFEEEILDDSLKNESISTAHKKSSVNKHGVPVLDVSPNKEFVSDETQAEDFETLLNEYYKAQERSPLKPTASVSLKKRLKRYPSVERQIDLHGLTGMAAQVRLNSFLHTCKNQGFFTVRVIVGKGLHSENGPVLPDIAEDLLAQLKEQNVVLWYEWEKKRKSNSGALTVYLKQFDRFD